MARSASAILSSDTVGPPKLGVQAVVAAGAQRDEVCSRVGPSRAHGSRVVAPSPTGEHHPPARAPRGYASATRCAAALRARKRSLPRLSVLLGRVARAFGVRRGARRLLLARARGPGRAGPRLAARARPGGDRAAARRAQPSHGAPPHGRCAWTRPWRRRRRGVPCARRLPRGARGPSPSPSTCGTCRGGRQRCPAV